MDTGHRLDALAVADRTAAWRRALAIGAAASAVVSDNC